MSNSFNKGLGCGTFKDFLNTDKLQLNNGLNEIIILKDKYLCEIIFPKIILLLKTFSSNVNLVMPKVYSPQIQYFD